MLRIWDSGAPNVNDCVLPGLTVDPVDDGLPGGMLDDPLVLLVLFCIGN